METRFGFARRRDLYHVPSRGRGIHHGDRRIVPGDIYQPMFGSRSGNGVAEVIRNKDTYHVKTSDSEPGPGISIHRQGINWAPISTSEFCVSCHQVAVHPGIKLEVVWEQYRSA